MGNSGAPLVSVVMPVLNAAPYLAASIDSVLNQTLDDLELIVVDDGSTDGSPAVVAGVKDQRVVLRQLSRGGTVKALNTGAKAARGKFLARMDADDVALPQRLERQIAALNTRPGAVVAGCGYEAIDETGHKLSVVTPPTEDADVRRRLLVRNPFAGGSIVVQRKAFIEVGGFPEGFPGSEDYEILPRLGALGSLTSTHEVLYRWRVHSGSTSFRRRNEQLAAEARTKARLWREAPAVRSTRTLCTQSQHYLSLSAETGPTIAAQLLETEYLVALEMARRGQRRAAARQIAALLAVRPRMWRVLLNDVPRRLRSKRRQHEFLRGPHDHQP